MIYTKYLSKLIKLSSSQKLIFATKPWLRGIDHMKQLEAEKADLIEALEAALAFCTEIEMELDAPQHQIEAWSKLDRLKPYILLKQAKGE